MRRTFVGVLLASLTGLAGFLLYRTANLEADYRRLIGEGEAALAAEQTFGAIEAFSGAIALKSDAMLGYLKRGETYRRRGELNAALRDLRAAARLDPTATRPLEQLGDVNFALERYARAAESYEAYVRLDDRSPRVLYKLGLARFRLGDAANAVTVLNAAVSLSDRLSEAHYLLGVCLAELGRTEDGIAAVERAVQLTPESIPAREELVSLFRRSGNDARVVQELAQLAALEPQRPERMAAVGLAYARMGRTDLAVVALSQAAERVPNDPVIYVALGRVWLEAAEQRRDRVALSKAMAALDRAARGQAPNSEALTLYGRALALAGDLGEAERTLQQAVGVYPVEADAFLHLAAASQRLGHADTARAALVRYLALTEDEGEIGRVAPQIAELSLRLGDAVQAAAWYRRTVEIQGETPANLVRLADAQIRAGDLVGARDTLAKGLEKDPHNPVLQVLARRVPR
jgi:tetratricopeptide (TPR) repeat protein